MEQKYRDELREFIFTGKSKGLCNFDTMMRQNKRELEKCKNKKCPANLPCGCFQNLEKICKKNIPAKESEVDKFLDGVLQESKKKVLQQREIVRY